MAGGMTQSPRSERQSLQFQGGRLDKGPEGHGSYDHTQDVGDVVAIPSDIAGSAAVDTAFLVCFQSAGEGGRDKGVFEGVGGRWRCRRYAGGFCEEVDEFEDEEARECAAEVGHAGSR